MSRAAGALWIALAVAVAAEWALAHHAPGAPWWHSVPGLQAVYGLSGCVAIVLLSKWLGRHWLQRPEPDAGQGGAGSPGAESPVPPRP